MPYLAAVRTLAGHTNFQQFEHFILAVALKRFRCSIVEKTCDREGLFDILVRRPDGSHVAIEAKATDDRLEANTRKHLKRLVNGWKPKKLVERLKMHRRILDGSVTAILATTATIKHDLWDEQKSIHGLKGFDLWDATQLASFAASDWAVASFFPGLPERTERYRAHSIDALRQAGSSQFGVALDDLIDEEARSSPSPTLGWNTLIVGPPYIGKTCWAVRRAWRTCCDRAPSSVLWFNAIKDSAEDLTFLNTNLPLEEDYVIVIDDIHAARANPAVWTGPVADFVARRPGRVRVLWVARDESIAESLSVGSERVSIDPFPISLVVGLFLERINSAPLDLRVVAALEAGLDPALGRAMTSWTWDASLTYPVLADKIRSANNARVRDTLSDIRNRLEKDDCYSAYLGLVPFGSIAFRVEERFVADMTHVGTAGLASLANIGVCTRSQDDTNLLLTEHPFQLRRTLEYVDERGTEPAAVQRFAQPDTRHPATTLSEAVLCRYVQSSAAPADALRKLNEHAVWAGVLDAMASAARHLVEATSDDALREVAREIAMKLSRTAYPRNETAYVAALDQDLRWWEAQHAEAASHPDEFYAGRRLDFILYEEAYIHYLCERYADAATIFGAAVDAGFRAIDRALDPLRRTADTLRRAQFALSNIWVAGLLERSAALREHFYEALKGAPSAAAGRTTGLAKGIAATYRALAKASECGPEGFKTGLPFVNAAREALRPEHQYPNAGLTIDLRERRYTDFLRRHQLNGWLHSLETSSWSWLFGSASARGPVPDLPSPSLDTLKTLAPLSDRDSRIAYRYRQTELLFRAAGRERLATSDALHVAAMLRAAGSFEYLGDHLLLAWRTADTTDERRAIAWFLRERVPNVGFNRLPKLALNQLVDRKGQP
jgi:hypothetical protein